MVILRLFFLWQRQAVIDFTPDLFGMQLWVFRRAPDAHHMFLVPGKGTMQPAKSMSPAWAKMPALRKGLS
ncbi:hypothetical protein ATE40_014810 [Serratia surfactantfaciens]|nr:hypothetical protein ATE40_014810 [Serratia surfactantfaciens]